MPMRLKVWCEGDDFTLLTESINISQRGFFVYASSPPLSGTCFRATIQELGVVAQVEVRWARRSRDRGRAGMGLQVVSFERGATALDAHMERIGPQLYRGYLGAQSVFADDKPR
jgi:hypothetical protein